jgi:hypothetical protein
MTSPTIKSTRHALMTGMLMGLLMKGVEDSVLNFTIRPVLDNDGNYTNVIELHDPEDDTLVFTVTLDAVEAVA